MIISAHGVRYILLSWLSCLAARAHGELRFLGLWCPRRDCCCSALGARRLPACVHS